MHSAATAQAAIANRRISPSFEWHSPSPASAHGFRRQSGLLWDVKPPFGLPISVAPEPSVFITKTHNSSYRRARLPVPVRSRLSV